MLPLSRAAFHRLALPKQRDWIDRYSSHGHVVAEAVRAARGSGHDPGDEGRLAAALKDFRAWQSAMIRLMEWAVEEASLSSYQGLEDAEHLSLATMAQDLEVAWWSVHRDQHEVARARHQAWIDGQPRWGADQAPAPARPPVPALRALGPPPPADS